MTLHYIKIALRNLLKSKTQTVISILGITAGIICFSVCAYYVRALYRGDTQFPYYKELTVLRTQFPDRDEYSYPRPNVRAKFMEQFREDISLIPALDYSTRPYNISLDPDGVEDSFRVQSQACNADFVATHPPKLISGSAEEFGKRPNSVIITEELSKKIFGNESPLGKQLYSNSMAYRKFNSPMTFTVVGVMKPYPPFALDNVFPFDILLHSDMTDGYDAYSCSYVLKPEVNIESLNERLSRMDLDPNAQVKLMYKSELREVNSMAFYISLIGLLVLLAGLLNFLNTTIHAFANRVKELGLRKTLGAAIRHQFLLLFTEVTLILAASFLLCTALTETLIPYLFNSIPHDFRRELIMDFSDLLMQQSIYFIYILLFSSLIIYIGVLRIKAKKKASRNGARNVMLGVQISICMMFVLATAATWLVSKNTLRTKSPYLSETEMQDIIFIRVGGERITLQEHLPEIVQFIRSSPLFNRVALKMDMSLNLGSNEVRNNIGVHWVSPEYFDMMKFPLNVPLKEDELCCFANEALTQALQQDSINYISINEKNYPILQTINAVELGTYLKKSAYIPESNIPNPDCIYVQLQPGNSSKAIAVLQEKIESHLPQYSNFQVISLKEDHLSYGQSMLQGLFMVCSIVCILITVLGLYGAITVDTRRKQKEVAIRKINGAGMKHIYWMFGRMYVWLFVVTGVIISVLALFVLGMMESNLSVFFDYTNPLYWIASFCFVAIIIMCTISYRIYVISKTNPAEIIKTE
ncbi:ABC transporter permease [Bacteroides sp. OttesenSCG-928-E20]|nr:ABC transporter permease [Bacteroides sp. OttesenSCG-928-E20]